MPRVRITGWGYGLQKVSMTKTIQAHLGYGLAEAKYCTDSVLEGKPVVLPLETEEAAHALARDLDALGAEVAVEPDDG